MKKKLLILGAGNAQIDLIEYAKEKYGVNKIEGTFAVDNIGSRRVMEKLGMTFDRDTEYTKFDNSATQFI